MLFITNTLKLGTANIIKKKFNDSFLIQKNMIEKLNVHHANNKYSYYYKNFNTGHSIKKEGRGRRADKYNVISRIKGKI